MPKNQTLGSLKVPILDSMGYHTYTLYLITCNNFADVVCPGLLFGSLNAFIAPRLSMGRAISVSEIMGSMPAMVLWSWMNLLYADLSNQRHPSSIIEDRLNKPWRPLPSGRLTPDQASRMLFCMYPTLIIVSLMVGGLLPSLSIIFLVYWYNEFSGAASPWLKNVLNGLGLGFFFAGPLEVITGRSVFTGKGEAAIWVAIIMAAIASTSHAQDFRDVEGDKAADRVTLPIAIGDINARVIAVVAILGWTIFAAWYWGAGWLQAGPAGLGGMLMAGNLLRDRTRTGDIQSWKLFPVWMLGMFLMPVLTNRMAAF